MGYRAQPLPVTEPDGVQQQALAVVEAKAHLPVLPGKQPAVQAERCPLGLADVQRFYLPQRRGNELGQVFAHDLGAVGGRPIIEAVLDFQQGHPAEVHDRMQASDAMRVRIAVLACPVPHVRPADPQAAIALGDERRAIGPDIGEHAAHVGDAAPGQRSCELRVVAQHLIALMPLVQRHVRLLARQLLPCDDRVIGQRHHSAVGLPGCAVPADRDRLAPH